MPTPALTADQRRAASAKAVAARRTRADVGARLKRGELVLADVLDRAGHDEALAGMRVRTLLESLPRVGPLRADRLMTAVRIAPSRRVRGLGPGQRAALLEATATAPGARS
jgi:hypothetical protein